jgi:hypothetical protein
MKEGRNVKRTVMILIATVIGVTMLFGTALADIAAVAKDELAAIGHDKKIVEAVKAQNAKGLTMDYIMKLDKAWRGQDPCTYFIREVRENECSAYTRAIISRTPYLSEIFVMDNQGANVCMSGTTGDFMQGDEDKWQKSFAEGKGAIFIDEPEEEDGKMVQQISVPVMDEGKAIGAITFGVYPTAAVAVTELAPIGQNDKAIRKAVKAQNKKGLTMDYIMKLDKAWKGNDPDTYFIKEIRENKCSDHSRDLVAEKDYLFEIFVMDNQGANVCMSGTTGDFMQGDEAKWQKSFADGKGDIFVDEPEEEDGKMVQQISVPVMEKGKAIGAITFGIYPDKVK